MLLPLSIKGICSLARLKLGLARFYTKVGRPPPPPTPPYLLLFSVPQFLCPSLPPLPPSPPPLGEESMLSFYMEGCRSLRHFQRSLQILLLRATYPLSRIPAFIVNKANECVCVFFYPRFSVRLYFVWKENCCSRTLCSHSFAYNKNDLDKSLPMSILRIQLRTFSAGWKSDGNQISRAALDGSKSEGEFE